MFRDVALQEKTRKITRIRIDKFTGGVIRQGLFNGRTALYTGAV